MHYLSFLICLCAALGSHSAKLPSSFTKCHWKHSDCLTKSIEDGIRQLKNPIKELNVASLAPLSIPSLTIGAGSGAVGFQQNYKDLKVSGFGETVCSKAEFDDVAKTLKIDCVVPQFRMDFDYEIDGKILLLPITGKGPGLVILHENNLILTVKLEEYEKNAKKYFKIVEKQLEIIPKRIELKLDNLFDGDKALGDNINQVMNDNWEEVYRDVRSSYEEAFGKIFASIFDNLLAKVPIADLMSNE